MNFPSLNAGIGLALFAEANPSVNITGSNCTGSLIAGATYCVSVVLPSANMTTSASWWALGCWTNDDAASAALLGGDYSVCSRCGRVTISPRASRRSYSSRSSQTSCLSASDLAS